MAEKESTTKKQRVCELDGCERRYSARGFCRTHYLRLKRTGTTDTPPSMLPFEERFWPKVNKSGPVPDYRPELGPCWIWTAGKTAAGYGRIGKDGEEVYAHRVSYELLRVPIPDGLELDHLCRVPSCVNPDHLEAVTHRENIQRGNAPSAVAQRTGLCQRGHADWGMRKNGWRICRTCARASDRAWMARRREAISTNESKGETK